MNIRLSETTRILLSLYIPSMIMSFGQGMVIPVVPVLATTFEVSVGVAAQVVTAQLLGRVASLIPAGVVIDRWGRRPGLIAGPLIIAGGAFCTAIAPNFWLLLLAQFVSGSGNSLWQTSREIAAIDLVRPDQRGRLMSGFMGMGSVGMALGPVLGGILTDQVSFRAVFWVYMLMALVTLLVSLGIKETRAPGQRERTPLFNIGRLSEVDPYFRATFVVLTINTFAAMMRSSLLNSMLPLYVGAQLGFSSTEVGALFGIYGLVNFAMIFPTGYLSDKLGRKAVVVPSTFLAAAAFVAYPFARTMLQLSSLSVLIGIATGLALGTMATYTYDVIPANARGRLQASRRIIGELGGVGGPIAGGTVANAYAPASAFLLFVPLQLISGVLITLVAKESLRKERSAATA